MYVYPKLRNSFNILPVKELAAVVVGGRVVARSTGAGVVSVAVWEVAVLVADTVVSVQVVAVAVVVTDVPVAVFVADTVVVTV